MSDDHWVTARRGAPLVVFNASGELVLSKEIGFIRDVRFAPDGGPLYAATTGHPSNRTGDRLRIIDRETGNLLHERTVTGAVRAIAVSTDRLWIARSTFRTGLETGEPLAEELFVELLDPETLEPIRSITVSPTLAVQHGLWPYHGETPRLLEDVTGTRLTYTGNADHLGVWSHVIEVF